MKIKEVIVVEGKNDTMKINQAVDAYTIETNGSAINQETLDQIAHAKDKRGVIIFTDPDYPGERIRRIVDEKVPGCKHAFLTQNEARDKKSKKNNLGIENASIETIKQALSRVYEVEQQNEMQITKNDLIKYGLIGSSRSKERRQALGESLRIGYANGKQLLKRLSMFNISKDDFIKEIEVINARECEENNE
ncbi:MAG TPA: ribonuclease M5 [Pseudogracilibacillus sp.]|nr:ribonuclease M5 [Pseudogracilibacillus sp.]